MTLQKKTVDEINVRIIQEVATDIGALVRYTSNIRGKTTKIQNLTEKYKLEIDDDLDQIKAAVSNYQKKLMAAVRDWKWKYRNRIRDSKLSERKGNMSFALVLWDHELRNNMFLNFLLFLFQFMLK